MRMIGTMAVALVLGTLGAGFASRSMAQPAEASDDATLADRRALRRVAPLAKGVMTQLIVAPAELLVMADHVCVAKLWLESVVS